MIEWILRKWTRQPDQAEQIRRAYQATFQSLQGQMVLQHMVNECYATVCYSKDPLDLAAHNARRSFVQEIVENVYLQEGYGRPDFPTERS